MKGLFTKTGILIISAVFAFASCGKEDIYTIVAGSNSEEMGTVTGDGNYSEGSVATLVAEPKPGYHFMIWADGSRKNPRKITVNKNMVLMAIFGIGERPDNGGDDDDENEIINPDEQAIGLSGTISESLTLKDRGLDVDYIVYDRLTIGGNANVTVEPDVKIMFSSILGNITVGGNASLNIAGTASKPVVFVGKTDDIDTGSWHGIELATSSTSNNWEYATFKNGGSGCAVSVRKGSLSMKSCVIDGSAGNGLDVWEDGVVTKIEDCIFKKCSEYPIVFSAGVKGVNINALGEKNDFFDNGENFIRCDSKNFGGDTEYVIRKMSVPYLFTEGIDISESAKFTIEPGVEILMGLCTKFSVGKNVMFKAVGTAERPISIRGDEDVAGHWDVLKMETTVKESVMEYCNVANAGIESATDCAFFIDGNSRFTMRNCTFTKIGSDLGVTIGNAGNFAKNVAFENITFKGVADVVYVSVGGGSVESGSLFGSLEAMMAAMK